MAEPLAFGTLRVGDNPDESLISNGANLIINGGTVEIAGRLTRPSYIAVTNFTMSGGTMILNKLGSNDSAPPSGTAPAAPFMIDVPGSKFAMSGGTIIIRQSGSGSAGAVNLGYTNTVGSGNVFPWCDEWVTYTSEWDDVSGTMRVEQFWYNTITYLTPTDACKVVINDTHIIVN